MDSTISLSQQSRPKNLAANNTLPTNDDNANNNDQTKQGNRPQHEEDFQTVFAPLAYHLFPDGYTHDQDDNDDEQVTNNSDSNDVHSCERSWPPALETRAAISASEALASLSQVNRWAARTGMTSDQQQVVCLVVCALASSSSSRQRRNGMVANSPLRDCRHIRSLLRTMLPRKGHPVISTIVRRLITRLCHPTLSQAQQQSASPGQTTTAGMTTSAVLQYLTLVVRSGALTQDAQRVLGSLYHILFACALDPDTGGDAVRLLCLITRKSHVRVHRAQRLRLAYATAQQQQQQTLNNTTAALSLLLQLYARYDPRGCGNFRVGSCSSGTRRRNSSGATPATGSWFAFPDPVWERHFNDLWYSQPQPNNIHDDVVGREDGPPLRPRKRTRNTAGENVFSNNPADESIVAATMDRLLEDHDATSFEAFSSPTPANILWASHLLQDQSLWHIRSLLSGDGIGGAPSQTEKESGSLSVAVDQDLIRIQVCLPYLMREEWYHRYTKTRRSAATTSTNRVVEQQISESKATARDLPGRLSPSSSKNGTLEHEGEDEEGSDDRDSDEDGSGDEGSCPSGLGLKAFIDGRTVLEPRVRLLETLAAMATQHGALLPETTPLIRQDILAAWDGTADWGDHLCWDLFPLTFTSSAKNLRLPPTFFELKNQLLLRLEPLFLYGTPRLQYSIVAGVLSPLLCRLAIAVSSTKGEGSGLQKHTVPTAAGGRADSGGTQQQSTRLLKEVIQWTENILLQGLLIDVGNSHGRVELLAAAALDFFKVVCVDVADHCALIITPSPALLYRLLLSQSPVAIDGACQLLVDYKRSFQKLKQRESTANNDNAKGDSQQVQVEGLDRVAVFNCFVWDFCSVLWLCSPLPSSDGKAGDETTSNTLARSMSILFTDIDPAVLAKLNAQPANSKVASSLSIPHGAVFAQYACDFLERKGVSNPSPDKLQGSLKREYLDYLNTECGMQGLYAFLTTFVASLAKREGKRQKGQQMAAATS